jgi:hypothetical protein
MADVQMTWLFQRVSQFSFFCNLREGGKEGGREGGREGRRLREGGRGKERGREGG